MAHADTDCTDTTSLRSRREPGAEPLPGYRLIAPLGQGGAAEVWQCEAPGGLLKAIKFVHGGLGLDEGRDAPAAEERRAIERVKAIRHPFLLSLERVEYLDNELVIVLELADRSLAAVLAEEQQAGRPGLPRDRLLGYLREAAEVLDLMNLHHDLQHLDVKPQNLFLVNNHVKVGDFGLVNSLQGSTPGQPPALRLGAITPVYAAPELFENTLSRFCDQYSLAIVYQELLTGTRPFNGRNVRQLLVQHLQGQPDLEPLPAADRAAVARALSKVPADRFPSCSAFVHALTASEESRIEDRGSRIEDGGSRIEEDTSVPRDPPSSILDPRSSILHPPSSVKAKTLDLGGESLDDLRLLDCISRSPLTEVRKAQGADGREWLVTVLFGYTGNTEELGARLSALHHPALPPVKVVRDSRGSLALITTPTGQPLRDRFRACVTSGLPGVPRPELLSCLGAAASALDFLYQRHTIAHLGLNPRNLLLDEGRLHIADFGLVQLLWMPAGQAVAPLNARYSAPELFRRQAGPACDQYSLALIYHEMLTGSLPAFAQARGKSRAEVGRGWPVLDHLPETDRPAIARALDPDPARRWSSCAALVGALENAGEEGDVEAGPGLAIGGGALPTRFGTTLTPGQIRARLDGFRQQWQGTAVREDANDFVYYVPMAQSFWRRWTGRHPGLEVRVRLTSSRSPARTATEVEVETRPHGCGREQGGERLQVIAAQLVESVRTVLQAPPRGRLQERLAWHHPLQVCSVSSNGAAGEPITCRGKDISPGGIGFYLPGELPTAQVSLCLPQTPQTPTRTVPARVVRIQGCGAGWYEVGAILLRPEEVSADAGFPALTRAARGATESHDPGRIFP